MAKDLYCYYVKSNNALIFYYDDLRSQRANTSGAEVFNIGSGSGGWNHLRESIEYIAFDESFWYASIPGLGGFFKNCTKLKSIENFDNFNTSSATDLSYLFYNCNSLKEIDFSNFRSGPATNWSHMFDGCYALTKIKGLEGVNTSNVTDMSYMFNNCLALKSLNMKEYFITSKVTNMSHMFSNCVDLTTLDLSNFNTSKVTDMSYMFSTCVDLTSLDLSSFNTANVTNMAYMFSGCEKLTSLNVNNFNTAKVTNMQSMFSSCEKLKELDVTSFDVSKVQNMMFLFSGCSNLQTIYCNCDWKDFISSTADASDLFNNDTKLVGGHYAKYDESWGIDEAHPDMSGRPGAFTAKDGLIFNGHLLTADNAQSFASSGTITYDPDEFSLTLNNATLKADAGLWMPYNQTLSLYLKGKNKISVKGNGIEGGDIFPSALTDNASLDVTSTEAYGIIMKGNCYLSGDELATGKLCVLNVHGHAGAINGTQMWNSYYNKYIHPSVFLGDMVLSLSTDIGYVVSGLEKINEKDIEYNYDTYYFNDDKGTVYDYSVFGVSSTNEYEGVPVTKPFKLVPKDKLVRYEVNLGGNWLNNYNCDDFSPMSLSSGNVTYTPDSYTLKLSSAKFNSAYVPHDELYALYAEDNFFVLNIEGDNQLTGTLTDDYSYGLAFYENEEVDGFRLWGIIGTDNSAQISLRGEIYFQSLGDENTALASIVDTKITVPDEAYFWQQDNVDVRISNSELDLVCDKWPNQNIMEYLNSLTLENCAFADGCYFDSSKGCVMNSSGQPATGRVRILRDSSGIKKGDVNRDTHINTADVVAIYSFIEKGTASGFTREDANVNGDANVNTADVVALYDIIIKGSK